MMVKKKNLQIDKYEIYIAYIVIFLYLVNA